LAHDPRLNEFLSVVFFGQFIVNVWQTEDFAELTRYLLGPILASSSLLGLEKHPPIILPKPKLPLCSKLFVCYGVTFIDSIDAIHMVGPLFHEVRWPLTAPTGFPTFSAKCLADICHFFNAWAVHHTMLPCGQIVPTVRPKNTRKRYWDRTPTHPSLWAFSFVEADNSSAAVGTLFCEVDSTADIIFGFLPFHPALPKR
jgi:hypothetical protein